MPRVDLVDQICRAGARPLPLSIETLCNKLQVGFEKAADLFWFRLERHVEWRCVSEEQSLMRAAKDGSPSAMRNVSAKQAIVPQSEVFRNEGCLTEVTGG